MDNNTQLTDLPRSRKEAKELGSTHYFTGKPCKNGHVDKYYTSQGKCFSCQAEQRKKWNEENAERKRELNAHWRENNLEKAREQARKAYHKDIEKSRKRNRDSHRKNASPTSKKKKADRERKRRQDFPEIENNKAALRRARKADATPIWVAKPYKTVESPEQYAKYRDIRKRMQDQIQWFYNEAKALSEATGIPFAVDHIWPITHDQCSGLHVPWNLQILTASENSSKINKLPTQL